MKIAIIGGGASGLMCACMLGGGTGPSKLTRHSTSGDFGTGLDITGVTPLDVTVFDKNGATGMKMLLTGNGRCNVTNLVPPETFLENVHRNADFLTHAVSKFTPHDMAGFLKSLGVDIHIEDNNRAFPTTNKSTTIRDAMQNFATSHGVKFEFNTDVKSITQISQSDNDGISTDKFQITFHTDNATFDKTLVFDKVVIATGGLSYPQKGSTGDGYVFAESFGHSIIPTRPGMCGIIFNKPTGFQGASINCQIKITDKHGNAKTDAKFGSLLFTDYGVSGPTVFKIVSQFSEQSPSGHFLEIDLAPDKTLQDVQNKIKFATSKIQKQKPFYILREFLPVSVANWVAGEVFSKSDKNSSKIDMAKIIKNFKTPLKDFRGVETAIVTRGGVDVSQIDNKTMQSKLVCGLYFTGEVMDVDGLSGGFNLQISFSTGVACALDVISK